MMRTMLLVGTCLAFLPAVVLAQGRTPMAAPAPATTTPTVGATVLDSNGTTIGTIADITPQAIVLDLDGTKIAVPPTSIGATAKGLAMAMTKEALQAAQAQQQAAADAAVKARLVAGSPVAGLNGAPVGTIKSADAAGGTVTLTTSKGDVTLPASGFSTNATGQLIIGLTQAQLDAAISGNGGAAATGGNASATASTDTSATATSPGIAGTAGESGAKTMAPPATPATTSAVAPKSTPDTAAKNKALRRR